MGAFFKGLMMFRQFVIVLILTALPGLVSAEFYRYVDKEGNVRFTDNLANVPVDQRSKVDEYDYASHPLRPEEKTEIRREEGYHQETVKQLQEPPLRKEPLAQEGEENAVDQRLKATGAKLQEEYQALMEVREQLEKAAATRLSPSARKALVKKITDFNTGIKDYENRRQVYNKEVKAYNARIEEKAQSSKAEKE